MNFLELDKSPLKNVLYLSRENDSAIIVGRPNAIYLLDPHLKLRAKVSTGHVLGNIDCPPHSSECQGSRTSTVNDKQVLLHIRSLGAVLICGKVWPGRCSLYEPFTNSTEAVFVNATVAANYVGSRESTVAFVEQEYFRTIFAASTYDGRPSTYDPFAVSARLLIMNPSQIHASKTLGEPVFNAMGRRNRAPFVSYIYGFSQDGFAYFVTVQGSKGSSSTWLARVCQNDTSFRTYTELPLECANDNISYPIARAATSGSDSLVVAFSMPIERTDIQLKPGSIVCAFDMRIVTAAFASAVSDCDNGLDTSRALSVFTASNVYLRCRQTVSTVFVVQT